MKLSIIIPCFNSGTRLQSLIDSITSQVTSVDYEVIIQDGMSTDSETISLLQSLRSNPVVQVFREHDSGIYDAMNRGVSHSHGEWLYFIGADDKFHSCNVFEEVFAAIGNGDADVSLIIGKAMFGKTLQSYTLGKRIMMENTVLHQAAFYRRSIFDNFSYCADYSVSSDYDLNFYCYAQHCKCCYVDTVICDFSLDGISSQVNWRSYAEEMAVRRKYIGSVLLRSMLVPYTVARYALRKIISLCN